MLLRLGGRRGVGASVGLVTSSGKTQTGTSDRQQSRKQVDSSPSLDPGRLLCLGCLSFVELVFRTNIMLETLGKCPSPGTVEGQSAAFSAFARDTRAR